VDVRKTVWSLIGAVVLVGIAFLGGYLVGSGKGREDYRSAIVKAENMAKLSQQLSNGIEEIRADRDRLADQVESLQRNLGAAIEYTQSLEIGIAELRTANSELTTGLTDLAGALRQSGGDVQTVADDIGSLIDSVESHEEQAP
jgi:uncharacterized phage infection (PIP) family protein YhgE